MLKKDKIYFIFETRLIMAHNVFRQIKLIRLSLRAKFLSKLVHIRSTKLFLQNDTFVLCSNSVGLDSKIKYWLEQSFFYLSNEIQLLNFEPAG